MSKRWFADDYQLTYKNYPHNYHIGAREAAERLLSRPDLPPDIEQSVRRNATWYLPKLPGTQTDISIPVWDGWSCFNPSIASGPGGDLRAIIRTANYVMSPEGRYGGAYDNEGSIRTRNCFVKLRADGVMEGCEPIQDGHLRMDPPLFNVEGFEDARLFWHDGWRFSATVRDRNERGICQQVMCELTSTDRFPAYADNLTVLSPAHDRHEKNWMPMASEGWTNMESWIYSCYPTIAISWHAGERHADIGTYHLAPYIARSFRGGSQVIPLESGLHLAIVHESVDCEGVPHRVYQHRFVLFGSEADVILMISPPFCFERRGVEFAAGMAIRGDDLLISYGVHDAKAMLHTMPLGEALSMLRPPRSEEGQ